MDTLTASNNYGTKATQMLSLFDKVESLTDLEKLCVRLSTLGENGAASLICRNRAENLASENRVIHDQLGNLRGDVNAMGSVSSIRQSIYGKGYAILLGPDTDPKILEGLNATWDEGLTAASAIEAAGVGTEEIGVGLLANWSGSLQELVTACWDTVGYVPEETQATQIGSTAEAGLGEGEAPRGIKALWASLNKKNNDKSLGR